MKIKQGTPEWHEQRKGIITGTRFQKAVKECIWTKGDQWEALGREMYRGDHNLSQDPFNQNAIYAMKWGTENEPVAIQALKEMGFQIVPTSFVKHKEHDWLGMSPDGLLKKGRDNKRSAIEIKCPISKPVDNVKESKRNYWHQMQLGMECMDLDEMLFVQWTPNEIKTEWVERDPTWSERYIPKAKEFLVWYKEQLENPEVITRWAKDKEEPGVNYKPVDEDDDTSKLASIIAKLKKLDEAKKPLEAEKRELADKLVEKHSGAFSTPTVKCHMTHAKGRINYTRMVKDLEIPYDQVEGYREEGKPRIYTKLVENKNE